MVCHGFNSRSRVTPSTRAMTLASGLMSCLSKQMTSGGRQLATHPGIRLCALCHVVCFAAAAHPPHIPQERIVFVHLLLILFYSPSYWDSRLSYDIFIRIHSYYQNLTFSDGRRRRLCYICSRGTAHVVPNFKPTGTNLISTLSWKWN